MMRKSVLASLVCALVLVSVASAGAKVEYMVVLVGGKKMGHGKHTREVAANKVTTTEETVLTIRRMDTAMTIRQVETAVETATGKPISFASVQDMGIMARTIEGTVGPGGTVKVIVTSGDRKTPQTIQWPAGALLPEGLRLLSKRKGLAKGTKFTAKAFVGSMLKAMDIELTVGEKKDVDLLGRVVRLTEVASVMTAPTGRMESTGYVDDEGNALKTIVPMMGMQLEMMACSKAVALAEDDPVDFLDKLIVAGPSSLGDVRTAKSITYHIEPTNEHAALKFLATPSQTVDAGAGGAVTVTVAPITPAKGTAIPYKGGDAAALAALKPAQYLQSDAKEIVGLAKVAVGGSTDAADAAGRIQSYVRKYISDKDLSVGYASALEVAKSRQGDCTEHAVLAAAMCRASGIPAQVVTGLAYVEDFGSRKHVFVPHAWFRAFVGGKWVDYDAALGSHDAGHIALAAGNGELDEYFAVIQTLGYFKIAKASVKR